LQTFVGKRCVEFKSLIDGGIIAQWSFVPAARTEADLKLAESEYKGKHYRINRKPTEQEYENMLFGWLVESGVTSNSVIYVKDQVKLADRYCFEMHGIPYNDLKDEDKKAEIDDKVSNEKGGLIGAAMVSDAFFPFRDGVDVGLQEGVTSVIQPGGSGNDYQSIEACNEVGATMVYTGQRSFKH